MQRGSEQVKLSRTVAGHQSVLISRKCITLAENWKLTKTNCALTKKIFVLCRDDGSIGSK